MRHGLCRIPAVARGASPRPGCAGDAPGRAPARQEGVVRACGSGWFGKRSTLRHRRAFDVDGVPFPRCRICAIPSVRRCWPPCSSGARHSASAPHSLLVASAVLTAQPARDEPPPTVTASKVLTAAQLKGAHHQVVDAVYDARLLSTSSRSRRSTALSRRRPARTGSRDPRNRRDPRTEPGLEVRHLRRGRGPVAGQRRQGRRQRGDQTRRHRQGHRWRPQADGHQPRAA